MIEKILHIKNVGKFRGYSAGGNVTLRRVTLIYAGNAQGKTTLCAILRSLSSGAPRLIEERRTLGVQEPPDILLRLAGTQAHFQNGQWDKTFSHIEIFDPVFVNQNVYAGDAIDFEQRRNLYRFAIGEEGVRLDKEIAEHTTAIQDLNKQIRIVKGQIQSYNMELIGDNVDAFAALPEIEDIDRTVEQKTKEVEALRQADSILSRDSLSELMLAAVPLADIQKLLQRQLEDVSAEAAQRVREHVATYMDERGEDWVHQGMGYIKDNNRCPFCGENISAASIVNAYQAYFSAAYSQLREDIACTSKQVQDLISEQHLLSLQRACNANDGHAEFWRDYVPAEYPAIDTKRVIEGLQALKRTLTAHLERKAISPLAVVTPDEQLRSAQATYTKMREQIKEYNARVCQVSELIEAKKAAVREADVGAAERELRKLQVTKCRYSEPANKLCAEYSRLQQEKKEHGEKKEEAQIQSQQYTPKVLGKYQSQINQRLRQFGADFQIVASREEFYGGNPSIDYQLKIRNERVPLAQGKPNQPAPCFKNTLSSGDKTTLAFAFFLARIDLASDIQEKVIVFDDPISSLDFFRRMSTCQAIRRIAARAKQVIVLSHDRFFLGDIWDHSLCSDRQALQIARSGSGSHIVEWDICRDTQSRYERNCSKLRQFVDQGQSLAPGTAAREQDCLHEVAKCIRPVLEHYIKTRCPGVFSGNHWWLGAMVQHIQQCSSADPANCLKRLASDLADINEYSAPFHHDQNPQADSHPVIDSELRAFVNRTLDVLQQ